MELLALEVILTSTLASLTASSTRGFAVNRRETRRAAAFALATCSWPKAYTQQPTETTMGKSTMGEHVARKQEKEGQLIAKNGPSPSAP